MSDYPYDDEQVAEFCIDCDVAFREAGQLWNARAGIWPARMQADATGYLGQPAMNYAAARAKQLRKLRFALGLPIPPAPGPLKGAFCIPCQPDASKRVWWPAFLAVDAAEQDRYIRETLNRGYNFAEILVSGKPYREDYPEIEPSEGLLWDGLQKLKNAGLTTIVAFDDTRWPDLSYLDPVVRPCGELIDWCMGIYEVNGVVKDPDIVLSLLKQSRAMLPTSKLAVHFTDLVNSESHGLVDWQRAKDEAGLNALFFQASAWLETLEQIDNRVQDYTRRLMNGMHGFPILSDGVFLFELSTTKTYRYQWTESQGIAVTDHLMTTTLQPDGGVMAVRPTGWCDGGTI